MGKISKATKEEVLDNLKSSRALQVYDSTNRYWVRAFDLFFEDRGERLDLGCGKCYAKVAEWLQR